MLVETRASGLAFREPPAREEIQSEPHPPRPMGPEPGVPRGLEWGPQNAAWRKLLPEPGFGGREQVVWGEMATGTKAPCCKAGWGAQSWKAAGVQRDLALGVKRTPSAESHRGPSKSQSWQSPSADQSPSVAPHCPQDKVHTMMGTAYKGGGHLVPETFGPSFSAVGASTVTVTIDR